VLLRIDLYLFYTFDNYDELNMLYICNFATTTNLRMQRNLTWTTRVAMTCQIVPTVHAVVMCSRLPETQHISVLRSIFADKVR